MQNCKITHILTCSYHFVVFSLQKQTPPENKQFANPLTYQWEQDLIDKTLIGSGRIAKAAIVGLTDKALRAWSPADFIPQNQSVEDLIDCFNGDTSGLIERCINLGGGTCMFMPGKLNPRSLYGTDGQGNGVCIYRTNACLLIIVYEGRANSSAASTLGIEAADHMRDNGR